MLQLLRKLLGFPNCIYNYAILKLQKVKYARNLRINGRIYVVSDSKYAISIGNNVRINSCANANPIGGDSRTIFFARGNGRIRIGDDCGISNVSFFACTGITLGEKVFVGGGDKNL